MWCGAGDSGGGKAGNARGPDDYRSFRTHENVRIERPIFYQPQMLLLCGAQNGRKRECEEAMDNERERGISEKWEEYISCSCVAWPISLLFFC